MAEHDGYTTLITMLESAGAVHRVISHEPEGRTVEVSSLRGNALPQSAKCVVVMVKIGKKNKKYALAVVGGDRRLDFAKIKQLYGASYVSFADSETAERLTGQQSGAILPFVPDGDIDLVVDDDFVKHEKMYFNAARLDRSVEMTTADYVRIAAPTTASIAEDVVRTG